MKLSDTHLAVRLVQKGGHGIAKRLQGELRIYFNRADGSFDRVATASGGMERIAMLRSVIASGCHVLGVQFSDETDRPGEFPPTIPTRSA